MNKTIVYKLRHNPTNLFYTTVKGRWEDTKTNLANCGKVYLTPQPLPLNAHVNHAQVKKFPNILFNKGDKEWNKNKYYTRNEDWELVKYELIEIK